MTFTYAVSDLSSNLARVRLLIKDTDSTNAIFQDEEINVFLSLEDSNLKRSAALAYETIAGNQAYVQKVMRTLDISTDGASLARALREQAAGWRTQAAEEEAEDTGGAFDYAELVYDWPTGRERLWNEALREG